MCLRTFKILAADNFSLYSFANAIAKVRIVVMRSTDAKLRGVIPVI